MFHPESNPLSPKSSGPKKPEKELVEIWLGKDAAAEMDEGEPEMGDEEDLNPKEHELTEKEKKTLWEMKRSDEVTLKNIPKWEELPDEETFKKDFKFDWIWEDEYREGRPLFDFIPRTDETLPSLRGVVTLPHAKVFDIAAALEAESEHPDFLNTDEVLEAIDAAGYRPATLEELLAYARDYWKPDADPKALTKAERELLHSQAPHIHGLNSVFSVVDDDGNRDRGFPSLTWDGAKRKLNAREFGGWSVGDYFLVLRKSSPS